MDTKDDKNVNAQADGQTDEIMLSVFRMERRIQ